MASPSFLAIVNDDSSQLAAECSQHCPICNHSLPVSAFGLCAARSTGRNLYCKACLNKKVAEARRAQAQRRATRNQPLAIVAARPLVPANRDENGILIGKEVLNTKLPHADRVLAAIHQGARTQKEILHALYGREIRRAVVGMDQVGDSLASLLFATPPRIKTAIEDGRRVYVLAEAPVVAAASTIETPFSFSNLGGVVAPTSKGRRALSTPSHWRAA